jgi:hypothetical protein
MLLEQWLLQKNTMEVVGLRGGNMGTARYFVGGAGTQTAGLGFGGYAAPPGNKNETEEYNGIGLVRTKMI